MTSEKNTSVSLYRDIAQKIMSDIKNMTYPSGSLLPTESELMEKYSASRDTVRKGLAILKEKDFIDKKQGVGCIVKKPSLSNFSLKVDLSEYRESSRKISIEYCSYETVMQALGLEKGKPVIKIERVLCDDIKPIIYDMKYIPFKRGTPFVEEEIQYSEFSDLGLIDVSPFTLKCDMNISVGLINQDYMSRILCTKIGEPVLNLKRTISDENGTVYAYQSTIIRKGQQMLHAFAGYVLEDD